MSLFHFPLAPSAAPRWVRCAGSLALCAKYPGEETQKSREGTAAHWVASESLEGVIVAEGSLAPNGIEVTGEMLDAVELYVDDVRLMAIDGRLEIEKTMPIKSIHSDNGGTPDCWHWDGVVLTVWDFKYGHGYVGAFENWQLIDYVAGIFEILEIDGLKDQKVTVRMRVVQPRNYHSDGPIREWVVKGSDLRGYFNRLRGAAEAAWMRTDAKCTPNDECKHCDGRHACSALQQTSFVGMDVVTDNTPVEMSNEALGTELKMLRHYLKRMEARLDGLEEQATAQLKAGKVVPGFGMEQTKGRTGWAKPVSEVIALGQMMGIDISKPGALTPTQAIKAGLPADLVGSYSKPGEVGAKLAEVDETRAARVFGGQ